MNTANNTASAPFWETLSLSEMSRAQWESLCDGCAKCCLQKLEDEDDGEVYYTQVHCRYLNTDNCQCTVYKTRSVLVPQCVTLTLDDVAEFHWLPTTCAYRLISEGKPLPHWHPLVAKTNDAIHEAGISIRDWALVNEQSIDEDDWPDHIIYKSV